jgi:hypothetical protein
MSKNAMYGGAVAAVIIIITLLASQGLISKNDFGVAFLALLGTFFGALFAFRLDEDKEKKKEYQRRKSAMNRALLVLGAQHNELRIIKKELEKFPHLKACAFNMNAAQPVETLRLEQKIDDLDFLLESEAPNMLFKLHLEQLRFDQALEAVRMRNKHCVDVLQPAMEKHDLRGKMVSDAQVREALGNMIYETAVNTTATMAYHVGASDLSIPELAAEFRALAKKVQPGEKFLVFDLVDPKPQFDPRKDDFFKAAN